MSQQPIATARATFVATRTASTVPLQTLSDHSQRSSLGWVKRIIGGVAITGLSLGLLVSGNAEAVSFTFEKIVDTNTPIPGGTGSFESLGTDLSLDNGNVAFEGDDFNLESGTISQSGIFTSIGGELNIVADTSTPIPGGKGNFEQLNFPSLDNGNVAFSGSRGDSQEGIYTNIGGELNIIADTNTPIPGGKGNFYNLDRPSLDNGNVAFTGSSGYDPELGYYDQEGLYTNIGGELAEVITVGDLLDGKGVRTVSSGPEGLSGNQIAFNAYFKDGSEGIYVATVPEPSSVLGTLAFGAFGSGWMLKRKL